MSDNSLEGMSPDAIAGLAMLAKGLSSNPHTRNQFLQLTKAANPNMSIPEVDLPFQINNAISEERGKREALEARLRERDIRDSVISRRQEIQKSKGLSDADIADVEKLMLEKGITNHETAADFMLSQRQSAKPTPFTGYSSHSMPAVDTKSFGGNINQWARNEAANAISDIRSGRITL